MSECDYLGCVLDELVTDGAENRKKVASGRKVAGAVRFSVNLHEPLLVPVSLYGSETMIWREKERFKIRAE